MGKIFDITDKLSYEESPVLKIKDIEVRVNDDASTMIKVMGKLGGNVTARDIVEIYDLLISEEDRKKIEEGLELNFEDFKKVAKAALDVATGTEIDLDEDEGLVE